MNEMSSKDLNVVQSKLVRDFKRGEFGKNWYTNFKRAIEETYGEDWPIMNEIFALTSQSAEVKAGITQALNAYGRWKEGLNMDNVMRSGHSNKKLERIITGKGKGGKNPKIDEFASALLGELSEVVIDRWMARIYGFKEVPTPDQKAFIRRKVKALADKLGVPPAHAQAALWCEAKASDAIRNKAPKDPSKSKNLAVHNIIPSMEQALLSAIELRQRNGTLPKGHPELEMTTFYRVMSEGKKKITDLDPKDHTQRTNVRGAEHERLTTRKSEERLHAYESGGRIEADIQGKGLLFKGKVATKRLYDIVKDELNLVKDRDGWTNKWEQDIKRNGYAGYRHPGSGIMVLFEKIPIKEMKGFDQSKILPAATASLLGMEGLRSLFAEDKETRDETMMLLGLFGSLSGKGKKGINPKNLLNKKTRAAAKQSILDASSSRIVSTPGKAKETIRLNKEGVAELRELYNLEDISTPAKRQSRVKILNEAKARGGEYNALTYAQDIIKAERPATTYELASMDIRALKLHKTMLAEEKILSKHIKSGDLPVIEEIQRRIGRLTDEYNKITEGITLGKRHSSRTTAYSALDFTVDNYDVVSLKRQAANNKGHALSDKRNKQYADVAEKIEGLKEKEAAAVEKHIRKAEKKEKKNAGNVVKNIKTYTETTLKAQKKTKKLLNDIDAVEKQMADWGYEITMGVPPKALFQIGKWAKAHMELKAHTLEQITKKTLDKFPELVEQDVYRALETKDPLVQRKAKSAVQEAKRQVLTHAKLKLQVENAANGMFSPKRKRPPTKPEFRKLKGLLSRLRNEYYKSEMEAGLLEKEVTKINKLQKMIDNHYRPVRKYKARVPTNSELGALKGRTKELMTEVRLRDQLTNLNHQIKTGVFDVKIKKVAPKEPVRLSRIRADINVAKRTAQAMIENERPIEGHKAITAEVINTMRTLKASLDMSYTLRQAMPLTPGRPIKAAKALWKATQAMFSKRKYEQIHRDILNDPDYWKADQAKLQLTAVGDMLSRTEEIFTSRFMDNIPYWRGGIAGSERHMVTGLNVLRYGAFKEFTKNHPNATMAEMTAWADYVNAASGRGNIGKAGPALQWLFFAPKFAVSRAQGPTKVLKYWKMPRVRKKIALDMAAFVGTGMATLTLAKLAGLEVGYDPRNADFGKIKFGNTRVDIWGGGLTLARLTAASGAQTLESITGWPKSKKGIFEKDFYDLTSDFLTYKLAPHVTYGVNMATGKNVFGRDSHRGLATAAVIAPILLEEVIAGYKDGGWTLATKVGIMDGFGLGTSTYSNKKKKTSTQRISKYGE